MPERQCKLCNVIYQEQENGKYRFDYCNGCHTHPFCPHCIRNTSINVAGSMVFLKNVSLCNTCYCKRFPECIDCGKTAWNRCEYCSGPLCSKHVKHKECLSKISGYLSDNPEWEAKEREEYMRAAEEKWAKILVNKAADVLRKIDVDDEYHIKDNGPTH